MENEEVLAVLNETVNWREEIQYENWYEHQQIRLSLAVFEIVLCIIIVVTNSFCLLLFFVERKSQKIAHKFIISLSLADLLQGLANPGIHLYLVSGAKIESPYCGLVLTCGITVLLISLFAILATSIDRYWAICHPVCYKTSLSPCVALSKFWGCS